MDYELIEELEELMENEQYKEIIDKIHSLDDSDMNIQLVILLAHAYLCLDRYSTAANILNDFSDLTDDDDITYHFELANCYYGMHKYKSALAETEKCIEIDENFVDAWLLKCYIYIDKDDDKNFEYASKKAKEIDPDAWETFFGENNDEPVQKYSEDELLCILNHINKYFGETTLIIPPITNSLMPISTVVIAPTKKDNFYKLITVGIGSYKANVPQELEALKLNRFELVAYLPPDTDVFNVDFKNSWICNYMQLLGNMTVYEDTWLGLGHTVSNGDPFSENIGFNGVILDNVHNVNERACECGLPNGDIVSFYQFIPLYEEEMMFKINNDCESLFQLFKKKFGDGYIGIIDVSRPNLCADNSKKKWAIPRSRLENVLEWSGADGCFATDKIMVENKKVGYMYREKPDNEYDSGWRFLAGDESDEYMNNSENVGIYKLNTVCNYDIDIIDFLESPIGSAFYRNKNGEFVKDYHFRKN